MIYGRTYSLKLKKGASLEPIKTLVRDNTKDFTIKELKRILLFTKDENLANSLLEFKRELLKKSHLMFILMLLNMHTILVDMNIQTNSDLLFPYPANFRWSNIKIALRNKPI